MKKILGAICLVGLISQAHAEPFNANNLYFGAGLSNNDLSGFDSATGYQLFAGYPLDVNFGKGTLGVEAGYMNSGDFETTVPIIGKVTADAKGLWGTAVGSLPITNAGSVIGRLGYDFGDDDGFMFGAGYDHKIADNVNIRLEYVVRDNIDSLQVNFVLNQ
jgi:opacity protein-like surface antigen